MPASDRHPQRKRPTTITLTPQQHRDLRRIADRRFSTVSQVIREFVQQGVERHAEERTDAR